MSLPGTRAETTTPVPAILCIFGAGLGFSILDSSAKYLVLSGMEAPFIAWVRFAVHAVLAILIFKGWRSFAMFHVASMPLQLLRGSLIFGATYFNFLSLQTLQLAEMVSIFFAAPLVITIVAGPLLGEWAGWRRWSAVICGFIGVLIITRPGFDGFAIGQLYALCSMFSYALQVVMTRALSSTETPASLMFFSALAPAVLMLPTVPYYSSLPESTLQWLLLLSLGFYGAFSHWLLIKAYRIATVSALAPYPYLQIVWMIGLGYLVYDELPDAFTLSGAAIIIGSGLYVVHLERRLRLQAALSK